MEEVKFKLSHQAMGALMLALQKCLMEQSDIVGILNSFELVSKENELFVLNPPVIEMDKKEEE